MYRLSLILLWAGVALFAVLSVTDAMIDFMGHLQGLFLAGTAACFVSAVLHTGLHRLNDTAIANRGKSEQVREDVDHLGGKVDCLTDQVTEVRSLTKAGNLLDKMQQSTEPEPEERDAVIYQFRIKSPDGADIIAGDRSPNHASADEILAVLDANDTGTKAGRFTAS